MRASAPAPILTDGCFTAVRDAADILPRCRPPTTVVHVRARRLFPGLRDNHIHVIRGGVNSNMELRWDGLRRIAGHAGAARRQNLRTMRHIGLTGRFRRPAAEGGTP
jgi:predicted amidohydrolase YtcJ